MISFKSKEQCCGCGACAAICPRKAISMEEDTLGFLFPEIDTTLCVKCGLCDNVCEFNDASLPPRKKDMVVAYACRNKDYDVLSTSRSGGVFPELAKYVISQSGAVYGAVLDRQLNVSHKRITNEESISELQGSKYSQSNMLRMFNLIKQDLRQGKLVLFSGTPCQVSSVKTFCGDSLLDKLITVDIICHGVGSPRVWEDYLRYIRSKEGHQVLSASFRDKIKFGWSGLHKESFRLSDGSYKTYDYTYYCDYHIRESCNVCRFASVDRVSDITIGDFWGWQKCCPPSFNSDDLGCSLVLCNTKVGQAVINHCIDQFHSITVPVDSCLQPALLSPTPKNSLRDSFESDYREKGFEYVKKKYSDKMLTIFFKRVWSFIRRLCVKK